MNNLNRIAAFDNTKRSSDINSLLPSEDMLQRISFPTSYGKSINKLSLSAELLNIALYDAEAMYNRLMMEEALFDYEWRVKSQDSIKRKYQKGVMKSLRFNTIFNDLLGLRLRVPEYSTEYPYYFRVVDMRNGKKLFDGYKAVHLYYQLDKFHYQIEVQLWSETDYAFNSWSHEFAYKTVPDEILAAARAMYDSGKIQSVHDFQEVLYERR